jgi:hypothetical protein
LFSKIWHIDGCFFFFIWHYPLHCEVSRTDTIIAFQSCWIHWRPSGLHLHKEVPYAGSLAEWACSAMSLPIQKPVNLFSLGVYHQNNLCIMIFVLYLCTL